MIIRTSNSAALICSLLLSVLFCPSQAHAVDASTLVNEVFVTFDDPAYEFADTITILGENLNPKDSALPEVTLGYFGALPVMTATATEIVVLCPENPGDPLNPTCFEGDFRLMVTTGTSNKNTDSYDLTVIPHPSTGTGQAGRVVVNAFSPINPFYKSLTVHCPSGKVSVGGGGRLLYEPGTGWVGQVFTNSWPCGVSEWCISASATTPTTNNWQLAGYVVCID